MNTDYRKSRQVPYGTNAGTSGFDSRNRTQSFGRQTMMPIVPHGGNSLKSMAHCQRPRRSRSATRFHITCGKIFPEEQEQDSQHKKEWSLARIRARKAAKDLGYDEEESPF